VRAKLLINIPMVINNMV